MESKEARERKKEWMKWCDVPLETMNHKREWGSHSKAVVVGEWPVCPVHWCARSRWTERFRWPQLQSLQMRSCSSCRRCGRKPCWRLLHTYHDIKRHGPVPFFQYRGKQRNNKDLPRRQRWKMIGCPSTTTEDHTLLHCTARRTDVADEVCDCVLVPRVSLSSDQVMGSGTLSRGDSCENRESLSIPSISPIHNFSVRPNLQTQQKKTRFRDDWIPSHPPSIHFSPRLSFPSRIENKTNNNFFISLRYKKIYLLLYSYKTLNIFYTQ